MANIDELVDNMNYLYVADCNTEMANNDLITYIKNQQIDYHIKQMIINLIQNDNYDDYMSIYNICIENDIELPPL